MAPFSLAVVDAGVWRCECVGVRLLSDFPELELELGLRCRRESDPRCSDELTPSLHSSVDEKAHGSSEQPQEWAMLWRWDAGGVPLGSGAGRRL